ncbi:MAG: ABC transporter ATP-binding protein [Clostridiales bacterium]|nr:ABC transporter ATP-binding protein [Clostridiales bacterium]
MLEVRHISKAFAGLAVLDDLSLCVRDREIVALTGPSGCGKTTLLNLISGIGSPDMGEIIGADKKISYMFQNTRLLPWRTVYDNIRLVNERAGHDAVMDLIRAVGLAGFEEYYPGQISGGMAKRCALARAFHYEGELLLMDEPFQGLDYGLRMEMLEMTLRIWKARKPSILFVTHEIDEALTVASRVAVLTDRPSRIRKEIELPGANGRDCSDPALSGIRQEIHRLVSGGSGVQQEMPVKHLNPVAFH